MTTALTDVGRRLVTDGRWIVVAVHVTALGGLLAIVAAGGEDLQPTVDPRLIVAAGLAVLALELRHGLAIARGVRPRGVRATLLALVVLVYLPLPWWGWFWGLSRRRCWRRCRWSCTAVSPPARWWGWGCPARW